MSRSASGPSSSSVRHQSLLIVIKPSCTDWAHLPDSTEAGTHRWLVFLKLIALCSCVAVCLPPAGLSASLQPSEGWCPERNTGGLLLAPLALWKPPLLQFFQNHSWLVSWFSSVDFFFFYLADFNLKRIDMWWNARCRWSIRKIFLIKWSYTDECIW